MDFKTVAKSKSTYGVIGGNTENRKNKKSLSNAEFQPSVIKKRGVYVEKKIQSSTDTQEVNDPKIQTKPPRRPRPGQKKFLASVLTILSKSTAGTQYPDIQDSVNENARPVPQSKDANNPGSKIKKTNKTKKTKYRSRVLNNDMLKSEKDQFIILQPKREITQTPSTSSFKVKNANDSLKVVDENEPKRSTIRDILENTVYSGVAEGITKEVLDGRLKKEKKLRINDDPETIASEIAKKDDKNMYNFFVDLLETTISVYNVKTEYEISDVSKSAFELDNAVVEKLDIKNKPKQTSHYSLDCTPKRELKHAVENDIFDIIEDIPHDIKSSEYRHPTIRSKYKAKSFNNPKSITYTKKGKHASKSKSFDYNKKYIRKPNKKHILNDLKEELAKETYIFNEPESIYDALKVMARNKRRNEKSIHFANKIDRRFNNLDLECMFQRRKVISFGSQKNNKEKRKFPTSELRNNKKPEEFKRKYIPSHHSLEVYGYDYEDPMKSLEGKRQQRIIIDYNPSPSVSGSNLGDYRSLIYTDSSRSILG